jgi:hypothetical protein
VAIAAERNITQKYRSLCMEIKGTWDMKCVIMPLIIGATKIVTEDLKKNLEAILEKHSIDSVQKTAALGTSHIIRKVLQSET